MALEVRLGSTLLTDAGSTNLGTLRTTRRAMLTLRTLNNNAAARSNVYVSVTGDGKHNGTSSGFATMSIDEANWFSLEIDSTTAGAISTTVTITSDEESWSHTFTGTSVAYSYDPTVTLEDEFVRFNVNEWGAQFLALYQYPADKIADGATTISFTSGGDDMELTISDSANGLGGLSVGDQIGVSGATNAANNNEWQVVSASAGEVKVRNRSEFNVLGSVDKDGVTEAAGAAITISLIPENTDSTKGTYTVKSDLEADRTATVRQTSVYWDEHTVFVSVKGKLDSKVRYAEVLTIDATADGAWLMDNGIGNPAHTDDSAINYSWRKSTTGAMDYDNIVFHDGVPDAPHHVGAAIDPTSPADLIDWWAPDLETGYSDGDPIHEMTGQANGLLMNTKNGAAKPQTYRVNIASGRAMTEMGGRDESWTASSIGNYLAADRTIYVVRRFNTPSGSAQVWWQNQGVIGTDDYQFDQDTGVIVEAISFDTAGNQTRQLNYVQIHDTQAQTGQIRICGDSATPQVGNHCGRIYAYNTRHTDETMDRVVRGILSDWGVAWAPTYNVDPATGNDTNAGTELSPLATPGEVMARCGAGTSPHIVIEEGAVVTGGWWSTNNIISTSNGFYGLSHKDPVVVRVRRTTAGNKYPTVRSDVELPTTQAATNGRFTTNAAFLGICPRYGARIPTSSPLREAGDPTFNEFAAGGGLSAWFQSPEATAVSELFGDESIVDRKYVGFWNCHVIGSGQTNIQTPVAEIAHRVRHSFLDCTGSHGHVGGHTVEKFISGPSIVNWYNAISPEPGHDSTTGVEISDFLSRGMYLQYSKTVNCTVDGVMPVQDSSGQQARNGGYFDRVWLVDNETGFGCWYGSQVIENLILEGGARSDGLGGSQDINWGPIFQGESIIKNALFLPETFGNQVRCVRVDGSLQDIIDHETVGGKAFGWMKLGKYQHTMNIEHLTNAGRSGPLVQINQGVNITINNCIHQSDSPVLEFITSTSGYASGDVTSPVAESNLSIDNLVWDGSGDFATVNGTAQTKTQIDANATIGTVTEQTVTFTDPTMNLTKYAASVMGSGNDGLDFAYEFVRRRVNNLYDAAYDFETAWDTVWNAYAPTDVSKVDGMLPGAVQVAPTLSSSTPADSASDVAGTTDTFVLVFGQDIEATDNFAFSFSGGVTPASGDDGDVTITDDTIEIAIDCSGVSPGGEVTFTLDAGSVVDPNTGLTNAEITTTFAIAASPPSGGSGPRRARSRGRGRSAMVARHDTRRGRSR